MNISRQITATATAFIVSLLTTTLPLAAADQAEVTGVLTANGDQTALPHVYVWPEKEGFYDAADPTWKIIFVEKEIKQRDLGEPIWDAAWVEIALTKTAEFGDKPELHVYSQSIKLSANTAGNLSGGTYPQIEITQLGPDRISGRIYHTETQEFFDDKYTYDFTFSAPISDPDAPVGTPLAAGGGEPGLAYLKWVETLHSGDINALKTIVPPDVVEMIESSSAEEAREQMDFMREMTPTDIRIVAGSIDGEIALLQIEGKMDVQKVTGEIEMTKMGKFWMPTKTSM